jgi:hypothetical protein
MPRAKPRSDDLAAITARREALLAELAQVDAAAKVARDAARDAGRPVLLAALDRIKIAAIDKSDARRIATALSVHGGKAVAEQLAALSDG